MILYIGNYLSIHGNTPSSVELLGKLLQERYSIKLISSKKNKVLRLIDIMYSIIIFRKRITIVLVDTYSTQGFYFTLITAILSRFLLKPYIPILRGGNLKIRLERSKRLSRIIFNKAYVLIAPSDYMKGIFKNYGYKNLKMIPNSISSKEYSFKLRSKCSPTLLWVRSFHKIYNPIMAIFVVEKLLQEYPETKLFMVGPDKDGSMIRCKDYVARNRLSSRVIFTGVLQKKEWHELSAASDIFLNTTDFDNTPVSVIEAMALGLPVVSTSVGGVPYLIENGKSGLLVEANDVEGMVGAIKQLVNETTLAVAISSQARERVSEFDWEKVRVCWFNLLDQFEKEVNA
ncbi:MAG: glycosyltransferase family 4 protein [Cyclobacteriaceae bacterium]|nr:glycosyltransferase family 4 protein [Cyclobacteriaceae bacterium]